MSEINKFYVYRDAHLGSLHFSQTPKDDPVYEPWNEFVEASAYDQLLQRIAEKNKFIDEQRENVKTLLSDLTISRGNELMNEKRIAELERENEALHLAYNGLEDIHLKLEQEVERHKENITYWVTEKAKSDNAYLDMKDIAERQNKLVSRHSGALKNIAFPPRDAPDLCEWMTEIAREALAAEGEKE